jgi:pimeloyl-ACP methyl ester carboxylesterase
MMAPPLSPLEMSVATADGVILKGILAYPETAPGTKYPLAVLAHQYPATGDSFGPLLDDLLDLGIATLAFDLRGHGASITGPAGPVVIETPYGFGLEPFGKAFMASIGSVGFNRINDDILRVAGWGAAQNFVDASRMLLVGASIGGSGAALASPQVPGLKGLITFGAAGALAFGDDGPARIRKALEGLKASCYLASSEGDPFSGADNVRSWSAGLGHVTTRLVPGNDHAMAIYYNVRDEVLQFVKKLI